MKFRICQTCADIHHIMLVLKLIIHHQLLSSKWIAKRTTLRCSVLTVFRTYLPENREGWDHSLAKA